MFSGCLLVSMFKPSDYIVVMIMIEASSVISPQLCLQSYSQNVTVNGGNLYVVTWSLRFRVTGEMLKFCQFSNLVRMAAHCSAVP